MAPTKDAQEAEAAARKAVGLEPGEGTADALQVADDTSVPGNPPPIDNGGQQTNDDVPPLPTVRLPFEDKRSEIINRFRTSRTQEAEETAEDFSTLTREALPPEMQPNDPPVDPIDPPTNPPNEPNAQTPAPELPKVVRVKVRGEEKDVPLEEIIANAQKAMAADDYLGEAKALLNEAKIIARNTAQPPRAGQEGQHHDPLTNGAHPADGVDQNEQPPHQEDPLAKLIETLQYGDPTEARALLENTIQDVANKAVESNIVNQRMRDEGARTAKVLKEFKEKNADLANDPMASAAIERRTVDLQKEDLVELGVDLSQLPTPGGRPPNADDIAQAHRFYRANGFSVRGPDELLTTAVKEFRDRFGAQSQQNTPANPAPTTPNAPPRVIVDRAQRREAIQPQPSRPSAPRPAPQATPTAPLDRSSIVQRMQQQRDMRRGRISG